MCGICGFIPKVSKNSLDGKQYVESMLASMHHRGPDDSGICQLGNIEGAWFGHRRLSIIDLSAHGHQPMHNEDGTITLIANGEIYNHLELRQELLEKGHRFRSTSDSEVILHLFEELGTACFERLRGMYAVAIYDQQKRCVTLARDPLGIKPLYVHESGQAIMFASEIGALKTALGKTTPDPAGLSDFLLLGCIPAPHTHIKGVRSLRPGEIARIENGMIAFSDDSAFSKKCISAQEPPRDSIETVAEKIRESVRKHLISDAPIGLFLSGGIDSGVIAGLARSTTNADIRATCVTVPGHPMDESHYARMTAQAYGIELTEVPFLQSDFESSIDEFFQHIDMPTIDGFNTFIVSQAARKAGLTVALSGIGGDELFRGYPTFDWVPFMQRIGVLSSLFGKTSRQFCAHALSMASPSSGRARVAALLHDHRVDRRIAHLAFRGLFVGRFLDEFLAPDLKSYGREAFDRYMDATSWATSSSMQSDLAVAGMDVAEYMQPMLLRDSDVFSMAHSLEVRTPLVDMEVVRTALPHLQAMTKLDRHPKSLLRSALHPPLPPAVVSRKKQGFSFPWQTWMDGYVRQQIEALLDQGGAWELFLSRKSILQHRDAYIRGKAHWHCIWAIYVLMRMLNTM